MKALLMIGLLFISGLSITSDAFAAIYKYTDKNGMIYFADDLQSIPLQYRAAARIVSGEAAPGEKEPENQNQQEARTELRKNEILSTGEQKKPVIQEKPLLETGQKSLFGSRVFTSVNVILSALFALVILGILDTDHKKIVKIVRVVIVWGLSVYLVYTYAGDVAQVFTSTRNHIEGVQHQSEEKGKKAAGAVKALNTIIEHAEKSSSPGSSGGTGPEKKE